MSFDITISSLIACISNLAKNQNELYIGPDIPEWDQDSIPINFVFDALYETLKKNGKPVGDPWWRDNKITGMCYVYDRECDEADETDDAETQEQGTPSGNRTPAPTQAPAPPQVARGTIMLDMTGLTSKQRALVLSIIDQFTVPSGAGA